MNTNTWRSAPPMSIWKRLPALFSVLLLASLLLVVGSFKASATGEQTPANEDPIVTKWYTWDVGAWTPNATGASTTHWPQTLVGEGQITPTKCETTYQQDKYVGTQTQIDAIIDDGILTGPNPPEDRGLVKDWKFVSTTECVTVVLPSMCKAAGDWYTELDDAAPVQTADGLVFTGDAGNVAVGYRLPVTGNLQGLPNVAFDATPANSTFHWRIVIDPNAGDITGDGADDWKDHYVSLSVVNGSTVTSGSMALYTRLNLSKTLAEYAAMWPNNTVASVGFHLDTNAGTDDSVTLKSLTSDCGSANFIPEGTPPTDPPVVTPPPTDPPVLAETGAADVAVSLVVVLALVMAGITIIQAQRRRK